MAKGDLKSSRSSGGWGSGYYYSYDDEGRGTSKNYWEAFEARFQESGFSCDWLLDPEWGKSTPLSDEFLYNCLHNMTYRYNIHDWAWKKYEDIDDNDGRVRRIVIEKCSLTSWHLLQARAKGVWDRTEEEKRQYWQERAEENEAAHKAAFEARRIRREGELVEFTNQAQLTAGMFMGDFQQAFEPTEVYGLYEGDWIDDPVSAYSTGRGFAIEERKATGIKLQITLSLDLSNSMYYNHVSEPAADSFRDIYVALEMLQREFPNDLYIAAFEFSDDGYEASERGRVARCISRTNWRDEPIEMGGDDHSLGAVEAYRNGVDKWKFSGEDTWMYPLFEEIEKWEQKHSDPGAIRLDLVISDAVLEHPSDIRRSDVIQERRNGNLHTVILNLMPVEEWANSDLPLRCVQYPASGANLGGMLRNLIAEFVAVYM